MREAVEVIEYTDREGRSPFARWFSRLDPQAAAKVTRAAVRLEFGTVGDVKGVGAGVFELRIHFGPGYRIYFGQEGRERIVLLLGGSKARQRSDIAAAHRYWADHKAWLRRGAP
jgi:putative addiction module killer protein